MRKPVRLPAVNPTAQWISMRLLLLSLALFISVMAMAQNKNGLDKKISFHVEKVSLTDALQQLRELSKVKITYNSEEVKNQPVVSLNMANKPVREVLEELLQNSNLQYLETDFGVLLSPRQHPDDGVRKPEGYLLHGQVTNEQGIPLPGISVEELKRKWGTITDGKGMFAIVTGDGSQLWFSSLGMKPQGYTVKKNEFIKIMMDTVAAEMKEVVINGYQTIDKRMSTASVFTLKGPDIIQPGVPSVDKMLQGKVPGLMIINNSGSPNATPKLRIRGTSTFIGNASPIWVVDGVIREDPVDLTPAQLNDVVSGANGANYSIIGNGLSGINPYDIESITFLRDAAATAIYGTRAANGVIVVVTKKGKAGPPSVSYTTNLGFQQRPNYKKLDLMNSKERVQVSREMLEDGTPYSQPPFAVSYEGALQKLYNRTITQDEFNAEVNKLETINTDWFQTLFRNAFNMQHNLSLSGGAGKTTYYGSFAYNNNQGAAIGDGNKTYMASARLNTELSKRLNLDLGVIASYRNATGFYTINPMDYALATTRALDPGVFYSRGSGYDVYGNQIVADQYGSILYNAAYERSQTTNTNSVRSTMFKMNLTYNLGSGFKITALGSAQLDATESMQSATDHSYFITAIRGWEFGAQVTDATKAASRLPYGGIATVDNGSLNSLYARTQLDYSHAFFNNRDQFLLTLGNELSSVQRKGFSSVELGYYPDRGQTFFSSAYNVGGQASGAGSVFYHTPTIRNTQSNTVSAYASATYSLNNKYVFNVLGRSDGSNRFGQYSNARFLPNVVGSFSWNAGDENWLRDSRVISNLRFRLSYGTQGNVVTTVGPNLIAAYPSSPVDMGSGQFVLNLQSLPYPYLRWEKTYQTNGGMDLSLFNHRLNITADVYSKKSKDLLANKQIAYEYGIDNMYENAGSMTNYGYDFAMEIVAISTRNTRLRFSFAYGQNFNNVRNANYQNLYGNYLNGTATIQGKPLNSFWSFAYKGLSHDNGTPLFKNIGAGTYKSADADPATFLVYSGRKTPLIQSGVNPSFSYKSFSLYSTLTFSVGAKKRLNPLLPTAGAGHGGAPNPDVNLPREILDRWRKPGDEAYTNIPALRDPNVNVYAELPSTKIGINQLVAYDESDMRVVSGDYLRCTMLGIGYALPASFNKRLGVKGTNLGASANNLFLIASKKLHGQDPETLGIGGTALPITRAFFFNLNVNF